MIRRNHLLYDLREFLGSFKLLAVVLLAAGYLILFVSLQYIYPIALLVVAIFAVRGLIGRAARAMAMRKKKKPRATPAYSG